MMNLGRNSHLDDHSNLMEFRNSLIGNATDARSV